MARASTTSSTNPNNWLSFSLSPMEMPQFVQYDAASSVTNSSHQNHHYFLDNMYTNGWGNGNSKSEAEVQEQSIWFMDSSNGVNHHAPPPKLEDFLGDSQTETQDSSLTHMYDHHQHHQQQNHHGSTYFGGDHHHQQHQHQHHQQQQHTQHQHQDLKSITGFQAFSNNSGSEVDDSGSIGKSQAACNEFGTHCVESGNEFVYSTAAATASGALSLGVAQSSEETAIVVADSDSSKKIVDTFGQRTSIYRGVTRHRWTGRYEAHLWDNSWRREGRRRRTSDLKLWSPLLRF